MLCYQGICLIETLGCLFWVSIVKAVFFFFFLDDEKHDCNNFIFDGDSSNHFTTETRFGVYRLAAILPTPEEHG